MHKTSFMQMVLGYIPGSEGYIPLFFQGTIVLGTVVPYSTQYRTHRSRAQLASKHLRYDTAFLAGTIIKFFFPPQRNAHGQTKGQSYRKSICRPRTEFCPRTAFCILSWADSRTFVSFNRVSRLELGLSLIS